MKKKVLGYAIGPVGSGLIGLITLPLLTWFYSTEDIGRIAMLQVVASLSMMLFTLGLDQAYVREYYESTNKPKLLKHCVVLGFSLILLTFCLVITLSPTLLSKWLYGIPSNYLSIASVLCFVLTLLSRFLSLILRMQERALAYSMSQLLPKVLFFLFITFSLTLALERDTNNLVTAHTLSISAVFIIYAWNTRMEWIPALTETLDKVFLKKLLKYGLPLIIGSLAAWGLNVMDRLFLRSMSNFNELGIYSVTMSFASAATIIAAIFNTMWAPLVLKWSTEGLDTKKIDQIAENVLAAVFFLTALAALFSWVLPIFLPEQYRSITYLLAICLLGPFFYTLSETTAIGITLSRRTIYSMLASVGAVIINGVGNFLLVPRWGALGAASATAIAFSFFYILRTEFACLVWRKTPRLKAYAVVLLLTATTIANGFFVNYSTVMYFVWFCILILGSIWFKESLKNYLSYIYKRNRK